MQTDLAPFIRDTPAGQEADAILRSCVHCGFCTATCPTYQLLGDELDGPRGRIYLIKEVLEGETPTRRTQTHLDRCLTCRSCETTCPSGVRYGRLVDIGREVVEEQVARPLGDRLLRAAILQVIPYRRRFGPLLRLGQGLRPLVPGPLRPKIPARRPVPARPQRRHDRRMLALPGCVQPAAAPATNAATARVLDRLGIELIEPQASGCCGAAHQHSAQPERARQLMRRNIDAWWPHVEAGAEAIVMTASGCGVTVKDYGTLLADDPAYAAKAARISDLTRDLGEILAAEDLASLRPTEPRTLAFHAPCTLQHGQQAPGLIEGVLTQLGHRLTPVTDPHLCCGSAGTYSLLQPTLANRLRGQKIEALEAGGPELIATANVGCQLHLEAGASRPVRHWVEVVAEGIDAGTRAPRAAA